MMPISAKTHGNQGARVLEEENAEMATRLRELKDSLRQRKEARGGGVIWRSGDRKSGLRSHANEVLDGRRGRNVRPANNRCARPFFHVDRVPKRTYQPTR
eukprot:m.349148 g.349148  ORF g.349148 m.349148 type:complete len:100 (-) comp27946_c1_seq3:214-513(-)